MEIEEILLHADSGGRSDTLTVSTETSEMDEMEELRIVLLGKTGVGKSAVGNAILGENVFKAECSAGSGTKNCERAQRVINGRKIVVIDTPGIFDTNRSEEEVKYEIISCLVECAPGPHVFILVLKVDRHTQENQKALEMLEKYFTGDAVHHMVLLFTHGDDLEKNMTIQDFINKSDVVGKKSGKQSLKGLAERCGNRVHVVDNKHWDENSRVSATLASLQGLNLSEQALREITEKMSQTPGEQTPWFDVLSDNGNAEAAGNEEQTENRNNQYQLTQLMQSVKKILTKSNSGHYSNKALEEIGKAINEEVKNILQEMGAERETVDMVEIRRRARERVRNKLGKKLAGVAVGILLGALLGVGVGVAAPVVIAAGLIRAGWRKLTQQRPQDAGPPVQAADVGAGAAAGAGVVAGAFGETGALAAGAATGIGAAVGAGVLLLFGAGKGGASGYKESKTSDNPTQAADNAAKAVTQNAKDVLKACWNLGNTETGPEFQPLNNSN